MSLRKPTKSDLTGFALLDILVGFYDRLVELGRSVVVNTVTQTFAATTDTRVFHGLGRPVSAWAVVDRNASAVIWQSTTENTTPTLCIILQASAIVTAKLRFE